MYYNTFDITPQAEKECYNVIIMIKATWVDILCNEVVHCGFLHWLLDHQTICAPVHSNLGPIFDEVNRKSYMPLALKQLR